MSRSVYQPPRQFGNYDVHELLGKGGMAAVFRGEHRLLQRPVAIKFLRSDIARSASARQRFLREARLVARLSHPNIVTVFDFGELEDGTYFQASELVSGKTLRDAIKTGPLEVAVALRFARQIALGLASAHAIGVIHRDLKPSNVMVVPDPTEPDGHRLKILDFGIAKSLEADPAGPSAALTMTGIMIGTPGYMAPEQCLGAAEIGPTADIYSLGVVLYLMLCGQPPFDTSDLAQLLERHIHEEPPRPSERVAVTPAIDELVTRCLSKSPADRPQSMTEVIQRLDEALGAASERPSAPVLDAIAATAPGSGHPPPPGSGHPPPVSPGGDHRTVRLPTDRPLLIRPGYQTVGSATSIDPPAPDTLDAAASLASTVSRADPSATRRSWVRWLAIAGCVLGIASGILLGARDEGDPAETAPRPPAPTAPTSPIDRPGAAPVASPAPSPPAPPASAPPASATATEPAPSTTPSTTPETAAAAPEGSAAPAGTGSAKAAAPETAAVDTAATATDPTATDPAEPATKRSRASTGDRSPTRRTARTTDERKSSGEPRRTEKKPAKPDARTEPGKDRAYERAVY